MSRMLSPSIAAAAALNTVFARYGMSAALRIGFPTYRAKRPGVLMAPVVYRRRCAAWSPIRVMDAPGGWCPTAARSATNPAAP